MPNKNEGNEKKKMLGVLNCAMDKIDRDGENKTFLFTANFLSKNIKIIFN